MKSTRYIYYININIFWSVYQYWVLNNNFILKILTFIRKTCHCVPFLNPVGIQYYPTVPSIFSPDKPGRWVSSSMKNVDLFSIIFPNKHARKSNEDLILKSHQPFGGHIFLGVAIPRRFRVSFGRLWSSRKCLLMPWIIPST